MADVILTGASWVSVVGLWCAAASAYVSPASFRLAGVMGIAFPVLLCGTVFCFFLCLLFCPRRSWISIVGILLCFGSVRSYIPFNPYHPEAQDSAITVLSYNCHGFPGVTTDEPKKEIMQYLFNQDADIICFQEGNFSFNDWRELHPEFSRRYPYHEIPYEGQTTRQSCYSRYRILRTELVTSHTTNAVVAFWLQLPKGDSLLVLNCHLKSNNLTPEDREQYNQIVKHRKQNPSADSTLLTSRTLASKISSAAGIRALMADTVANYLARNPGVPTIVCGDFNDTPISYSAKRITRSGLNDAFRAVGNGMGRSFNRDAIAVRIDHQFCSDHFKPVSAEVDDTPEWSDHYPIIVKYNWNNDTSNKKNNNTKK